MGAHMQVFKAFTAVLLLVSFAAGPAGAKSLRDAGEPAEFPPSDFSGKQYVDSNGCVFVRAGIGGNVTWVPRVSRSRQQICGQEPTFASAPVPEVPSIIAAKPAQATDATSSKPAAAPRPRRIVRHATSVPIVAPPPARLAVPARKAPPSEGYRAAWEDDRLNPFRAIGTAEGQAQMEKVWTNTVPRRLIAMPKQRVVTRSESISVSTKTAPVTVITSHRFVQIGAYENPANAHKAIAHLRRLNLPVRIGRLRRSGREHQIVLAGPFKRQENLEAALSAVRDAGVRNARLRK